MAESQNLTSMERSGSALPPGPTWRALSLPAQSSQPINESVLQTSQGMLPSLIRPMYARSTVPSSGEYGQNTAPFPPQQARLSSHSFPSPVPTLYPPNYSPSSMWPVNLPSAGYAYYHPHSNSTTSHGQIVTTSQPSVMGEPQGRPPSNAMMHASAGTPMYWNPSNSSTVYYPSGPTTAIGTSLPFSHPHRFKNDGEGAQPPSGARSPFPVKDTETRMEGASCQSEASSFLGHTYPASSSMFYQTQGGGGLHHPPSIHTPVEGGGDGPSFNPSRGTDQNSQHSYHYGRMPSPPSKVQYYFPSSTSAANFHPSLPIGMSSSAALARPPPSTFASTHSESSHLPYPPVHAIESHPPSYYFSGKNTSHLASHIPSSTIISSLSSPPPTASSSLLSTFQDSSRSAEEATSASHRRVGGPPPSSHTLYRPIASTSSSLQGEGLPWHSLYNPYSHSERPRASGPPLPREISYGPPSNGYLYGQPSPSLRAVSSSSTLPSNPGVTKGGESASPFSSLPPSSDSRREKEKRIPSSPVKPPSFVSSQEGRGVAPNPSIHNVEGFFPAFCKILYDMSQQGVLPQDKRGRALLSIFEWLSKQPSERESPYLYFQQHQFEHFVCQMKAYIHLIITHSPLSEDLLHSCRLKPLWGFRYNTAYVEEFLSKMPATASRPPTGNPATQVKTSPSSTFSPLEMWCNLQEKSGQGCFDAYVQRLSESPSPLASPPIASPPQDSMALKTEIEVPSQTLSLQLSSSHISPLPSFTVTKDTTASLSSIVPLIQLRALKLANFQDVLRQEICIRRFLEESPPNLPPLQHCGFKITRKTKSLRISREEGEKFVQQRQHLIQGRRQFIGEIVEHSRKYFAAQRDNVRSSKKVVAAVLRHFTSLQKKEELTEQFEQKSRLDALKAHDEVGYLKLLKEAKNERLLTLLHQTEESMRQIGNLVIEQRERDGLTVKNENLSTLEGNSEEAFNSLIRSKERYYHLTHTINEKIVELPKCLKGGNLRSYQLRGLNWLVSLYNNGLNGILADAMGLGKTVQTVSLLAYLYEFKGVHGPHLIVAPLSTLHGNWVNEFNRWLPGMVKCVYEGQKEWRKSLRSKWFGSNNDPQFQVLLTTDAFVIRDKSYLRKFEWEYLIVDEAHRLKNPNSKLVRTLNQGFNVKRRVALTGTPLQNDLQELWALLNFLMPRIFCSAQTFDDWFNAPLVNPRKSKEEPEHVLAMTEEEKLLIIDRLHKVLRPFLLRREKAEVADEVPSKQEQVLWCPLSGVQRRLYNVILENPAGQNRMVQLRKVCNHPYLYTSRDVPSDESIIRTCGKFVMLDNILTKFKATNHRVLIFSQMTRLLDLLEIYLNMRSFTFLRMDGNTPGEMRQINLQLFNQKDSPYFVFILSTKAGGLGINLQSADTVIIFDSDWNPQNDEQAQSRAHRIGQTREVLTIRFITPDSIEETISEAAGIKLDQDALVIKSGMFHGHQFDMENERKEQ
ncbi:putative SWI2/SNF2 Brahma-like [Cardiosporidium cionae]|uniref:SWI2/SNF2 Brahma-like n=1 Tax=Cardiosporidium cionae TaxID=476202 RepID=A0ABQ7J8U0_9APIC|nr:putative SWI2/SNF2 Brahma-like [Cardiosporidium cionae]|eukprot:KAF8820418.1 putative SWI2/SNF2 Brahma-like [Cardiosporidium cionae]